MLALFGLTWHASNIKFALLLWLWFTIIGIIVLYLLKRNTKSAKVGAALLEWNTIFLLFLPKHIQAGMQELKKRERKET